MYIVLNKYYKGLILCLIGLSDKYKCQQATRINKKHLQRNRSKYNQSIIQNMISANHHLKQTVISSIPLPKYLQNDVISELKVCLCYSPESR